MFIVTTLSFNNINLRFNQLIEGLYFTYILSFWGGILAFYYIQYIMGIRHTWLLKRPNNECNNYIHVKTKLRRKYFKGQVAFFGVSGLIHFWRKGGEQEERGMDPIPDTNADDVNITVHYMLSS